MKTVIYLVLFLVSLGLLYLLYATIQEPIAFQSARNSRRDAVVSKLKDIRSAQKLYRSITDTFATNFNDLQNVLSTGRFEIIQVTGDRDAVNAVVHYDTIYVAAKDSLASLKLDVSDLSSVPNSDKKFEIFAGEIEQQGIPIPVVEVSAKWSDFMGKYGTAYYSKYDKQYDPTSRLKFGSRRKANLSGNWE